MNIGIIGNSNSILKEGWVKSFSALTENHSIVNYSLGGSPCLLGLYRASEFLTPSPPQFDLAIVEFSVIDSYHLSNQHFSANIHKSYVYHLMLGICESGCLPLIIILPRKCNFMTMDNVRTCYRSVAHSLGLPFIDAHDLLNNLLGGGLVADDLFVDDGHLSIGAAQFIGGVLAGFVKDLYSKGFIIPDYERSYKFPFEALPIENLYPKEQLEFRETGLVGVNLFKVSEFRQLTISAGKGRCLHALLGNFMTGAVLEFDNGVESVVKNCFCGMARKVPSKSGVLMTLKSFENPVMDHGAGIRVRVVPGDTPTTERTLSEAPPLLGYGSFELAGFLVGPSLDDTVVTVLAERRVSHAVEPDSAMVGLIAISIRGAIKQSVPFTSTYDTSLLANKLVELAQNAIAAGRTEFADSLLHAAVAMRPHGPFMRLRLAQFLTSQNRLQEAIEHVLSALQTPGDLLQELEVLRSQVNEAIAHQKIS